MPATLTLACQDTALDTALLQACAGPYAAATGRAITVDPQRYTYDAVADMVDGGATRWDVCQTDATECALLGRAGLMTTIDWKLVDRKLTAPGFTVPWWGVPAYLYSYVIAFDRSKLAGPVPNSWRDLWDTTSFPGKRIIPAASPTGLCEAALMSTGILPAKLYPLDMTKALDRLKLLRDQMLFAPDEATAATFLQQGQGQLAFLRSTTAQMLKTSTQGRIDFTWTQAILAPSLLSVPKEAPVGADAMRLIATTQQPAVQMQMLQSAGCGPADPAVHATLPPPLALLDPGSPAHRAIGVSVDATWYLGNMRSLQPRWASFITG